MTLGKFIDILVCGAVRGGPRVHLVHPLPSLYLSLISSQIPPLIPIVTHTPSPRGMSDPSSSMIQSLFDAALDNYEQQTGMKLIDHPLARQLEDCNSVESITAVLQNQARAFTGFRRDDGKLMKPLKHVVHVLHALSTSLVRWTGLHFQASISPEATSLVISPCESNTRSFCYLAPCTTFSRISFMYSSDVQVHHQAIRDVNASYDALVDLLESVEQFMSRLDIYIKFPPTARTEAMGDIIVKILVELLSTIALVTKQIKQKRPREYVLGN